MSWDQAALLLEEDDPFSMEDDDDGSRGSGSASCEEARWSAS